MSNRVPLFSFSYQEVVYCTRSNPHQGIEPMLADDELQRLWNQIARILTHPEVKICICRRQYPMLIRSGKKKYVFHITVHTINAPWRPLLWSTIIKRSPIYVILLSFTVTRKNSEVQSLAHWQTLKTNHWASYMKGGMLVASPWKV